MAGGVRKPVGIREVADRAGVSVSTVSFAFSGKGTLSDRLRRRVLKTARELGYHPSALARGLRGARTHSVGVLWALAGPQASVEMTRRIAMRAQKHGYVTSIVDTLGNRNTVDLAISEFARRRTDSIVIEVGPELEDAAWLGERLTQFRAVVAVTGRPCILGVDQIVRDRDQAYRAVADHFVKTGRRAPALAANSSGSPRKVHAFVTRLSELGVEAGPDSLVDLTPFAEGVTWARACYNALEQRFPQGPTFDAIMCTTDEIAVAAMSWLRSKGVSVPADVAVVGSNDNEMSPFENPPLASIIRQDEQVAEMIETMLFARLADPELPVRQTEIPMQFVWRESAGEQHPRSHMKDRLP